MFMRNPPDAVVLCGGAGLRLRTIIGEAPKAMAYIGGRPFLELLLKKLDQNGFRRVILAVGYQKDVIRSFFGEKFENLELVYSEESIPMGTGGAVRNAVHLIRSDAALVTNGDSYTDANLLDFIGDFLETRFEISVLVVPADERADCGAVLVDKEGSRLMGFGEKKVLAGSHYISAGIYMLSQRILQKIPAGVQLSIEHELFPRWLKRGIPIRAFVYEGWCLDIGTPDRYQSAQELLRGAEVTEALAEEGAHI